MLTFTDYIESLAIRHQDIRHQPGVNVHFISSESEKQIATDSVLQYPGVILDKGKGFKYGGAPGAYNKSKDYMLMIVEHVSDTGDYAEINGTLNKCEEILDSIINRIVEDKRDKVLRPLLASIAIEDIEGQYIQNYDKSEYGVVAFIQVTPGYTSLNCTKQFLLNRAFDQSFDNSFK